MKRPNGALYPWVVLLVATSSQATLSMVAVAVGALAPLVKADLNLSHTQFGLVGPAVTVGMAFTSILQGRAADLWGERRVLFAGSFLAGLITFLVFSAHSFLSMLGLLLLIGTCTASGTTAGTRLVTGWFPRRQWALALGVRQTGIPLGGLLGATLLPSLAAAVGWRAAFATAGTLCIATGLIVLLIYREPERSAVEVSGVPTLQVLKGLLRHQGLWWLSFAAAWMTGAQFSMATHLTLYLHSDLGLSIALASLGLAVANTGGIIGRILWGLATDTLFGGRRQWGMGAPSLVAAAAAVILAFLAPGIPLHWVLISTGVLGFGVLGWAGAQVALVVDLVPPDRRSMAVGFSMAVQQAGLVVVSTGMGFFADVSGSYRLPWLFMAATLVMAVFSLRYIQPNTPRTLVPSEAK